MNWYYADQGQQTGPVDEAALDQLVRSGAVPASALIWTDRMPEWKPYYSVRTIAPVAVEPSTTCVSCGRYAAPNQSTLIAGRILCPDCKPVYVERLRETEAGTLPGVLPYASVWTRYAARMVDTTFLNIVQAGITGVALAWWLRKDSSPAAAATAAIGVAAIGSLFGFAMKGAYEAYFLSTRGATPGKMLYYLQVVTPSGRRIDIGNAFGRYFAELLDVMTMGVGYLMAVFDVEKRTLHDRVAGTRVISMPPGETLQKPVDRKICCANCNTEIPVSEWNLMVPFPCTGCGKHVQAVVFPAISRILPYGVPELKSIEGDAGCYYHDGNRASSTCEECGRFLCAACDIDAGARHLCPNCFNGHLNQSSAPEFVQRRTLYDSIALAGALVPNLLILTIYLTFLSAPAVIGFSILNWKKPSSILPRSRWRFIVAMMIATLNIAFVVILIFTLITGAFK